MINIDLLTGTNLPDNTDLASFHLDQAAHKGKLVKDIINRLLKEKSIGRDQESRLLYCVKELSAQAFDEASEYLYYENGVEVSYI